MFTLNKVEESKILAGKILMLTKENRKTILNVLNAFVVAETATKLGVDAYALNEIMRAQ